MRRLASLALGSLLVLGAALAAPAPPRAPEGEFQAKLFIIRGDKALDFWHRTDESSGPHLALVGHVNPNDSVLLLVVLQGLGDAGGGKGKVTLTISTIDPAGQTQVMARDVSAWDGPLPPEGILVMSQAVPEFFLDEEPMGTTTIVVEARDAGSGTTSRSEAQLELVPWSYGDVPADAAAFEQWMWEYYLHPKPAEAVRAWLEYANFQSRDDKSLNYAVLGFFKTVFQASPWLVDHLVSRFDSAKPEQGTKIMLMLHLLGQDERLPSLPLDSDKVREQLYSTFAQLELPDPYAAITGSEQLDLLWGEFLATGRYRPVRQLILNLGFAPFEADFKAYSKSKKTDEDKERALKGLAFQAARWSLDSNMEAHPLVAAYARWAAKHETLGKDERAQLEALLAKHGGAPAEPGR